jgi:hypothetical protein
VEEQQDYHRERKIFQDELASCVKDCEDSLRSKDGNFRDWDEKNMTNFFLIEKGGKKSEKTC